MYIIDVLVVNRKAFAEFYEKYHAQHNALSKAIKTRFKIEIIY